VGRPKSREEKLFAAAVLRRSFELSGNERHEGFRAVFEGVLRDLQLTEEDVSAYLRAHGSEVDAAVGRGRP
jgi:hypothetical protein